MIMKQLNNIEIMNGYECNGKNIFEVKDEIFHSTRPRGDSRDCRVEWKIPSFTK